MREIHVSAPGRVCLFGEDVDYMGLEVINFAINRRIELNAKLTNDNFISVKLRDMDTTIEFKNEKQELKSKKDYIFSAFNLYQEFLPKNFGAQIEVKSNLYIGKGLSSSSAFCAALVAFFDQASGLNSSILEIAKQAYIAEVVNLNQAGGMMDHFASVVGDLIYLECRGAYRFEKLNNKLEGLIVGDTLEQKETIQTHITRRQEISDGIRWMKRKNKNFNLMDYPFDLARIKYKEHENIGLRRLLGVLGIRDVVRQGYKLMKDGTCNNDLLAELINKHHFMQQEYFENVTPKMREQIKIARDAGAIGCKLVGSGNGGSFLAYAPTKTDEVLEALTGNGAEAYLVKQDQGLSVFEK